MRRLVRAVHDSPASGPRRDPLAATRAARNGPWLHRLESLWWLVAPVAAVIAYRNVVRFDFVADARFLILENRYLHDPSRLVDNLVRDYFWSSSGNIIPYWRPVTKGSWALEYQVFGNWAGGFLLVQVAWFIVGVLGVQFFARRLGLARRTSLLVGLVLALHPVAIEPVCLLMARSDVVAMAGAVWAVASFREWRSTGRAVWFFAHVLAVAVALGSKEQALFLPLLCVAWILLESDGGAGYRARLLACAPSVLLGLVYFVVRHIFLEREAATLSATRLAFDPLRLLVGIGTYLRNTWPLSFGSSIRDLSRLEAQSLPSLAAASSTSVATAALTWWSVKQRDRLSVALVLWVCLALAPVLLSRDISVPTAPDKYALADRWLLHALAPALLVWFRLLARAGSSLARVAEGACAAWAALSLAVAPDGRVDFATEASMLDNEDRVYYLDVPPEYRTRGDRCRFKERKVVRAAMRADDSSLPALVSDATATCGERPELALHALGSLVRTNRFAEAEPLALRLLEHPPADARSHGELTYLAGVALLNTGRAAEAEVWLRKSLGLGNTNCRLFVGLAEAARSQKHVDDAVARLDQAFLCGGARDSSLPLTAAAWLLQADRREEAVRLLASLGHLSLTSDQSAYLGDLRRALESDGHLPAEASPIRTSP